MKRLLLLLLILLSAPAFGATKVYLHAQGSAGVSGYKLASPTQLIKNIAGGGTQPIPSITQETSAGNDIQFTDKASGGHTLVWISPALASGVTISGTISFNIWAKEAATANNSTIRIQIIRYTGGAEGATISNCGFATELTASMAAKAWTTAAGGWTACSVTSTAMSAGDRIVIKGFINGCTTTCTVAGSGMGTGTVTADYDSGTNASDGDSSVSFTEALSFSAEPEIIQEANSNCSSTEPTSYCGDPNGLGAAPPVVPNAAFTNATTAGTLIVCAAAGQSQRNSLAFCGDHANHSVNSATIVAGAHATVLNTAIGGSTCSTTTGFVDIGYHANATSGSTTFDWWFTTDALTDDSRTIDGEIWLYEIKNAASSSPLDTGANAVKALSNQQAASTTLTGPTLTTTGANDIIISSSYLTSQEQGTSYPWARGLPISNGNANAYTGGVTGSFTPTTISNGSTDCFAFGVASFWQAAPAAGTKVCTMLTMGAGPC